MPDRAVNLSSYVDTTYQQTVSWRRESRSGPFPDSDKGTIYSADLHPGTYVYSYQVTDYCLSTPQTRNLYIDIVDNKSDMRMVDTLVVCKNLSYALNLNQIIGVDLCGQLSSDLPSNPMARFVKMVAPPSSFAGARILDALAAHTELQGTPYMKPYKADQNAVYMEFDYTAPPNSCIKKQIHKLVIIVSSYF